MACVVSGISERRHVATCHFILLFLNTARGAFLGLGVILQLEPRPSSSTEVKLAGPGHSPLPTLHLPRVLVTPVSKGTFSSLHTREGLPRAWY